MSEASSADDSHAILAAAAEAWSVAGRTWDAAGLAAGYTEDAVFFGGRPGLQQGSAGVRAYFDSHVGTITRAKLTLRDQQVFRLAPDVIVAQGFGHFALGFADGRSSDVVQRATLVLVRRDGRWSILLHHFSDEPQSPPLGLD
ncbi:MAG: SgcJ/EcaC family oxidoreductase [Burkholderiales bacterium]